MKTLRKLTAFALAALMLMTCMISFAADGDISLEIDGVPVGIDTNGSPCTIINLNGQTFASVRPILEFLGYEVYWTDIDGEDRVDALSPRNSEILLPPASPMLVVTPGIYINYIQLPPDSNGNPAVIVNRDGRVYVPIRALLEYLGFEVEWADGLIIATSPENDAALEGDTSEILAQIIADADEKLAANDKMPMAFANPATAETAQGSLGLTAAQFNDNVEEAYVSVAMIGTFAHQVALIKCNDENAAKAVKAAVAAGFDSTKWICVFPEQSFVVESGEYVLMAATTNARATELIDAFAAMAGAIGDVDVFFGK